MMAWKISHNKLFAKHYMSVEPDCVEFYENASLGTRRFAFKRIEYVVLSPDNKLSFQVGEEVFSIQTVPGDAGHQAAIKALLQAVFRTTPG
jgi:hypothetical protein